MHPNAALSCADGLAVEAYQTFEGYFHTVLYYGNSRPSSASRKGIRLICGSCVTDASDRVLGLPHPWSQIPAFSPLIPEERWNAFRSWVSGFFVHRDIHSGDFNDLEVAHPRSDKPGSLVGVQDEVIAELTSMQMHATQRRFGNHKSRGVAILYTVCSVR